MLPDPKGVITAGSCAVSAVPQAVWLHHKPETLDETKSLEKNSEFNPIHPQDRPLGGFFFPGIEVDPSGGFFYNQ